MAGALLWRGPAPPLTARPNMAAAGGGRRALLPLPVLLPVLIPALLLLLLAAAATARLYRPGHDPLTVLTAGSVRPALLNSSAAWVVQFYSSSCGHCIAFAPTWRALAGDVKGEARSGSPHTAPPARPCPAALRGLPRCPEPLQGPAVPRGALGWDTAGPRAPCHLWAKPRVPGGCVSRGALA